MSVRCCSSNSGMVFRRSALPSPGVIRPPISTTVTPLASRYVARSAIRLGSSFLFRRGPLAARAVGSEIPGQRQFLGHDYFRAARTTGDDLKFIHEGAHKEYATTGGAQQVFLGKRIGHAIEVEALPFIDNVNNHFFRSEVQSQVNLLFRAFFVAVMKGIDDAFAHRHSDAIAVVFAKSRCLGHAQTHFLGEIDALDLRLQSDFKMLRVLGHAGASPAPTSARFGALYGYHRDGNGVNGAADGVETHCFL